MTPDPRPVFWRSTKRLTALLLVGWLALNLFGPWFARDFNGFKLFGFPFGFWIAAQGALVLYLVLIVVYVWRMDRLEAQCPRQATPVAQADGATDKPGVESV